MSSSSTINSYRLPGTFRSNSKQTKAKHANTQSQPDLLKDYQNKQTTQTIQLAMGRMVDSLGNQILKKETELHGLNNDGMDHKDFHLHIEACEKLKQKQKKLGYILKSFVSKEKAQHKSENQRLVSIRNLGLIQRPNPIFNELDKYFEDHKCQVIHKYNKISSRIKIQLQKLGLSKQSQPQNYTFRSILQTTKNSQYIQSSERSSPKSLQSRYEQSDSVIQSHKQNIIGNKMQTRLSIMEYKLRNVKFFQ